MHSLHLLPVLQMRLFSWINFCLSDFFGKTGNAGLSISSRELYSISRGTATSVGLILKKEPTRLGRSASSNSCMDMDRQMDHGHGPWTDRWTDRQTEIKLEAPHPKGTGLKSNGRF